jgi:hypothetical protein
MKSIPANLLQQALKPKGQNPNEKLKFIIDWYRKTSILKPTDSYQKNFCIMMGEWATIMEQTLLCSIPVETKLKIDEFLPTIDEKLNNSKTAYEAAFFYYLFIELSRVIE